MPMGKWYEVKFRRLLPVVGCVVVLAGVGFFLSTRVTQKGEVEVSAVKSREVSLEGFEVRGPVLGRGKEVILIANPSCSACRAFVPEILKRLKGYSLYYKHVRYRSEGDELERAIECVRQRKEDLFWDFLKMCYSHPTQALNWLSRRTSPSFVQRCLLDEEVAVALREDDRQVRRIGVSAIPAIILEGELYQGGLAIKQVLFGGE